MIVPILIEDQNIEVGSDAVVFKKRIIPLQKQIVKAGSTRHDHSCNRLLATVRIPIVPTTRGQSWLDLFELQIAVIPGSANKLVAQIPVGTDISVVALISGGRTVNRRMTRQGSAESYGINCLGQEPIGENRIVGIADVIDDDVAVGLRPQSNNIISEVDLANERGSKGEIAMWRQVVNDLAHRSPLVGATESPVIKILQDTNCRQVACAHVLFRGRCGGTLDVQLGTIKAVG